MRGQVQVIELRFDIGFVIGKLIHFVAELLRDGPADCTESGNGKNGNQES
ncbi:MAG: hypothetical protein WAK24_10270 [Candidatus Acidiferrales bacterium]